jgi:membrane protein required for colicin V production
MNLLDIMIIVTMVFLIVRGLFRGFFKEIGSLAGVILGIWLANLFQPQLTGYLKTHFSSTDYLPLISFGILFIVVLIMCNVGAFALSMMLRKAALGWADRGLGIGLAVVKGVIIIYLVIVLLTVFVPTKAPFIAKSKLAPLIIRSYQSLAGLISPDLYREWKKRFVSIVHLDDGSVSESPPDDSRQDGQKEII